MVLSILTDIDVQFKELPGLSHVGDNRKIKLTEIINEHYEGEKISESSQINITEGYKELGISTFILTAKMFHEMMRLGEVSTPVYKRYDLTVIDKEKTTKYTVTRDTYMSYYGFFLASTTFIPTLLFLFVIFVLLVAKILLGVIKISSLYFLERVTEDDPIRKAKEFVPFTLLGLLIGIVGGLIKLMISLRST